MATPKFKVGQIVRHRKFDYRGVIFGVDAEFGLEEEWYETMAHSRPPRDKPWYHVLVDDAAHSTYVAERHLYPAADNSQINHPALGSYFDRFDGVRYFPVVLN